MPGLGGAQVTQYRKAGRRTLLWASGLKSQTQQADEASMTERPSVPEVVGTCPTDPVGSGGSRGAKSDAGVPRSTEAATRPLWASLLQPAGAHTADLGAGPLSGPERPSEHVQASPAPASLQARPLTPVFSSAQADRLLASLKGVALSGGRSGPQSAPATAPGVQEESLTGPEQPRPAHMRAGKAEVGKAEVGKAGAHTDGSQGATKGTRDPRNDDILPSRGTRRLGFRLR